MASIIKSIAFKNFYNFYGGYEDNCFIFKEGLNIINADNGMGKSKMYNGFLWILKDTVYDSDERSFGAVEQAAIKMASEKAKASRDVVDFGVRLVFEDEINQYSITKSIKLTRNLSSPEQWMVSTPQTDVTETNLITHNSAVIYDINKIDVIIKERLLAQAMQPYSLLQGEAIDNIVDLSNASNLSKTVEALTDLSEIKTLEITCKNLFKSADKDLSNKQQSCTENKKAFEEAQASKKEIERQIDANNESVELYKRELQKASEEATKYSSILNNTAQRVKYRELLHQQREALANKESELNDLLSSVNDNLFKKPLPWILYGTEGYVEAFADRRAAYTEAMLAKKVASDPQKLLASILPEGSPDDASLAKMLDQKICFVCNRPFTEGDEHYKHIEMLLHRSKENPAKEDSKFKSFFGDIQKAVSPFMKVDDVFGLMAKSIGAQTELKNEITQLRERIKTTLAEFNNYGGTESDAEGESDKNVLAAYEAALNNKNLNASYLKSASAQRERLDNELKSWDKKLSEYGGAAVPQSYRDQKEIIDDIRGIFARTKQRIYDEVVDALERKSNSFYQKLTAGNNVEGGKLSFTKTSYDSIQLKVINEAGGELTGASEGFQRMKKIAVLMAIISSKFGGGHYDYPFIADAPFSAFGKNFINNFFDTVPSVFRQCIIMIKDLYDVNSPKLITEDGERILNKMKSDELPGTFYVISIPEISDPVNMSTDIHPYKL